MFSVEDLYAGYDSIEALRGISLKVDEGEIVCLLGANGAGKSTTLRAISGIIKSNSGNIMMNSRDISGLTPQKIVKLGISQIPEGRQIFPGLTVMEHFELGAFTYYSNRSRKEELTRNLSQIFELFPVLADKKKRMAGNLSGGEQQMVAIGRALMSQPKLLLLDEPTMGLAPILVKEILNTVKGFPEKGISALLVEQNAHAALRVSVRGYVLVDGKIVLKGASKELLGNNEIGSVYLGSYKKQ